VIKGGRVITGVEPSSNLLELGTLYFEKGELNNAVSYLTEAQKQCLASKKLRKYFNTSYMLLRSYLEMGKSDEVQKIKIDLQKVMIEENIEMTSRLYYTMGICSYLEAQKEQALTFFNQSFNVALAESNKEDMCYALCGKAIWYKSQQDFEKAFAVIENLKVFFESISVPEVEASVGFCEAQIFDTLGKYDEALVSLRQAFNVTKKSKSIHFMNAYIMTQFGATHTKMGQLDLAENYFDLAEGLIHPKEHVRTLEFLNRFKAELANKRNSHPDIKINIKNNTVEEISKGQVELNNQFILLELLVEFVKKKGSVMTKSDLAEIIWNQDYDPSQHDNKIYVTIRRLRKLLEPNPKKPHYILRTKEGYQLNPASIVEIQA
jgi:tetratricopeptide (TPR) repeat protein